MKVAFRLRRLSELAPATALLLPSQRPEDVLRLCTRLGGDALPHIYAVADGFLLQLSHPLPGPVAGAVRLRNLADNLLLPVDAELVPGLLPDEAAALVRERGLVFLPGDRVLEFSPGEPLPLGGLLGAAGLERRSWQALPEAPALAERLSEITLDLPEVPPEVVLEAGGEGIGTETPQPPDAGLPSKVLGTTGFNLGKGLAWLGKALHLGWLARAGAHLMAGAVARVPRLSEALLGRQGAALRELLRQFREGDVERALRHALPLGSEERGATPAGDARLPTHDLRYSLADLLGGGGPGRLWYDPAELRRELENEYRKQAERATRQGDFRRAAFIYGKLLGDYSSAAAVLARGGLHRDAAVIYLARLGDTLAAAREYEAAGEVDRALQLYRQRGEHELAGDLLRRAGEEEAAVAEYRLAADRLVATGRGHFQAGEMLLNRARRPDLAREYFQAGWEQRPDGAAVPCAIRLARLHARDGAPDQLLALAAEAEQFFGPAGNDGPAAEFYKELARLAAEPALVGIRADLRDRALLGIAAKMRQRVEGMTAAPNLVSTMLGQSPAWSPAIVSDAQWAVKSATKRPAVRARASAAVAVATVTIQARNPIVRAVCWAPDSGDVFLGFESGEVACFQPRSGEVVYLPADDNALQQMPVISLASSDAGDAVVVIRKKWPEWGHLSSLNRRGAGYRLEESRVIQTADNPWLGPVVAKAHDQFTALWNGVEVELLQGPRLLPVDRLKFEWPEKGPATFLLLPSFAETAAALAALWLAGEVVGYIASCLPWQPSEVLCLGWGACPEPSGTLKRPSYSWFLKGPSGLELAELGSDGALNWSDLQFENGRFTQVISRSHSGPKPHLAVAIVRPGLVAALTPDTLQMLRCRPGGCHPLTSMAVSLPEAVACFPHSRGQEFLVVTTNGRVARVPLPSLRG
jgi:tetratricopeptide (TPR) repeat protein